MRLFQSAAFIVHFTVILHAVRIFLLGLWDGRFCLVYRAMHLGNLNNRENTLMMNMMNPYPYNPMVHTFQVHFFNHHSSNYSLAYY